MNGAGRRSKGAAAERELSKLLAEHLGTEISRNLEQTRSGGHDLIGIPGWALEIKRQEKLSINAWWQQALEQSERSGLKPALAYRQSRKPWCFVVRLADIAENMKGQPYTAETDIEGFCLIVRESISPLQRAWSELAAKGQTISREDFDRYSRAHREKYGAKIINFNTRKAVEK